MTTGNTNTKEDDMELITAYGATVQGICGTDQRGLVSVTLGRGDAGYAVNMTTMGTRTLDAHQSVHFVNLDEARKTFDHFVTGLRRGRELFGH